MRTTTVVTLFLAGLIALALDVGRRRRAADHGVIAEQVGATEDWSPKRELRRVGTSRLPASRAELVTRILAAYRRHVAARLDRVESDLRHGLDAAYRRACERLAVDAALYATLTVV
jgi:hypothetical protein